MGLRRLIIVVFVNVVFAGATLAQSPNGTISGTVFDPMGKAIAGAEITIINDATRVQYFNKTNDEGLYVIQNLSPGQYRLQVAKVGFKTLVKPDIVLNVQDALAINFDLTIGAIAETVTVEGGAPMINIQDASVSTVVDRDFAENLPMSGRSFQTLIQLAPGVVVTASNFSDGGQFSVNGQRSASNYWMVDGVSANIGIGATAGFSAGNGFGGALGSFSAFGGTNSLVSIDAMQEFRIQTSTYAPEFGRTPGGQISIVTRSGTNQFHGTLFDYLRNDALDANDWFGDEAGLPKPKERQNDFGGTYSGPMIRDRTFVFFAYEGLRLQLPETTLSTVPDLAARQSATPSLRPYLNAFPLPNGVDDPSAGTAQFNASYSNPGRLDAYSLRVDHKVNGALGFFGRYNYSPSQFSQRGSFGIYSLNTITSVQINTQTATAGVTWAIAPSTANDLRFNFSNTTASSYSHLDGFGGAIPLGILPLPSGYTSADALFSFDVSGLTGGQLRDGWVVKNLQRQINLVDNLSVQKSAHSLKFGVDLRRLTPVFDPAKYAQQAIFGGVFPASTGELSYAATSSAARAPMLLRNLGFFAQDTWKATPRLTVTFGARWDVDFSPSTTAGPSFPAATGFNLNNLSDLALAPAGTPAFRTSYGNVAPRLGVAYQLRQSPNWQAVLRGGFGVFFDLATQEVGNAFQESYPFGGINILYGPVYGGTSTFPLNSADAAPPPITAANLAPPDGTLVAFDPALRLPYTLEWNVAVEQGIGKQQTISASYIGSVGERLIQTAFVFSPNSNIGNADLITNAGTSEYHALQVRFQRRLYGGFQALASYTWSHSIDTGSAGSIANLSNALAPGINIDGNRGPSDFDIRQVFSTGLTYDLQVGKTNRLGDAILKGWSTENTIQIRTALPVDVVDGNFFAFHGGEAEVRPDVVPDKAVYLHGSECLPSPPEGFGQSCPGGKGFNPNAFTDPPVDSGGNPIRQGDLGRNALRGFGAAQWDFAVHRSFPIHESLELQFRAEMFNVLNHPNFGPPSGCYGLTCTTVFGLSNQTLGQYLSGGNTGGGGLAQLYQMGGPRSIQLALKVQF